jgi:hypothetical protein
MSAKISTEDLMKPRWKVIADYPNSPYKVGDLVQLTDLGTTFLCTTTKEWDNANLDIVDNNRYFHIEYLEKWNHLFQKLEWWMHRQESEMPEYVKCECTDFIKFKKGQIVRVEKHQSNTYFQWVAWLFISADKQGVDPMMNCVHYKNFSPSTETEYLNQQTSSL